jgi:uncharacterized protein (TIGR03118 family)
MQRIPAIALAAFVAGPLALSAAAARATDFFVTNLVTDDQMVNAAQITDPELVNAWGVSYAPTGPFWVSATETGVSTVYSVDPATNATAKVPLTVAIPGDGSATGQVYNGGSQFNGDLFLFGSEDGTVSGWRLALGTTAEVLQTADPANSYKGAALGTIGANSYLYLADFAGGEVDVLKGDVSAPSLAGSFLDPNLPAGFAPFNVQILGGTLFVTYAVVGPDGDDVPGAGNGVVDAFDLQGNLIARISAGGVLDSPWGLAIAPASFGDFAGNLLVGNFGDGRIHAFDLGTNTLAGVLTGPGAMPIEIEGLWALIPGNGATAGSPDSIYFSAGPADETHGLFGVLSAVPEPDTLALMSLGLVGLARLRRRR